MNNSKSAKKKSVVAYPNNLRDLQAPIAQSSVSIADLFDTVEAKDGNLYVVFVPYSGDLFLMMIPK